VNELIENGAAIAPEVRALLRAVFRKVISGGTPKPLHVLVEDESGIWKKQLRFLSQQERRSTVLVYFSASALDFAGRLAVGSALGVPPSVVNTEKACLAANAAVSSPLPVFDPLLMDGREDALRVSLYPEFLWKRAIGTRGIQELFLSLAEILDVPPILDTGPTLLLWGKSEDEICEAWKRVDTRPGWADWSMPALNGVPIQDEIPEEIGGSVARLPDGKIMDHYSLLCRSGASWQFRDLPGTVPECGDPESLEILESKVFRVPSWVVLDLDRISSPGECLLQELSRNAALHGRIPWVSGVDERALVSLLALHSPVLIDGKVLSGM